MEPGKEKPDTSIWGSSSNARASSQWSPSDPATSTFSPPTPISLLQPRRSNVREAVAACLKVRSDLGGFLAWKCSVHEAYPTNCSCTPCPLPLHINSVFSLLRSAQVCPGASGLHSRPVLHCWPSVVSRAHQSHVTTPVSYLVC